MKKQLLLVTLYAFIYMSVRKIKVWKILPALIFIMTFTGLTGQQPERMKEALIVVDEEDGPDLESLARDVHRAIYFIDGDQVLSDNDTPGEEILVAFCDAASVNSLYEINRALTMVQMLRIEIASSAETSVRIDLSRLSSFLNLKFVYILFTTDVCGRNTETCLEGIVREMITGTRDQVRIIYELSVPQ